MKDIILSEVLIPSLHSLYEMDYDNIRFGVSERNICARLAHHMECLMRKYDDSHHNSPFIGYYADVEYNRMRDGDLKHFENSRNRPQYMVSDLLIQNRGYDNLLAVEMKKKGNNKNVDRDKERLLSLVSSSLNYDLANICVHNTLLGAFIEYSKDGLKMELFESINGKGQPADVLKFRYQHGTLIQL